MSYEVTRLVYSRVTGSPVRKAILVYFAERASDGGEGVWAAKTSIAQATELGRSTVFRAIDEMVKEGILIRVGTRPCQHGETVEYDMNLDLIHAMPALAPPKYTPRYKQNQPVPERDPSRSGTPPVPQRDVLGSRSGTQTILGTTIEPSDTALHASEVSPKPARRASALPHHWVPSARNRADAKACHFTDEDIDDQAAAFRDYHLARGTSFKDWDAGWRTWLGHARRYGRPAPARHARTRSAHDVMLAGFQRAALRDTE